MKSNGAKGQILARGDRGFEEAVQDSSFSVHRSGRWPAFVHQANTIDDVVKAVKEARLRDLKISICSGGHSWSQNHIRDGALMIDLSRLNEISIDADAGRAIIGPACLSGDLDAELAKRGLFFPVAHAYSVGMGGFLLQGGYGWNSRVMGMGCENVVAIDVVLADGSLVHANESENSDLLWAARGAGPGFFGVVVRFHLKLHPRPGFIGMKFQTFRIRHLEDVLTWTESIRGQVSPKVEFQMVINRKAFGIFSHGIEIVTPVIADSRKEAKDLVSFISNSPIRRKASFTLPLASASLTRIMRTGERVVFLSDHRWYTDNVWLKPPLASALPTIRRIVEEQPEAPSHVYFMSWNPDDKPRTDMAFSMERELYMAFYGSLKPSNLNPADEDWATRSARALEPFAFGSQLGDENLARRPSQFMAPANFERLEQIRDRYDPDRRFNAYGHMS